RYDPDLWTDEFAFLSQPGQADIQSDLFYDYRTNVESYPKWQAWMREKQPRLLRSEEHTSELQSQSNLVCRLLLEKKKKTKQQRLLLQMQVDGRAHGATCTIGIQTELSTYNLLVSRLVVARGDQPTSAHI